MTTVAGQNLGHLDLVTRTVVAKAPDHEAALVACLNRWTGVTAPTSAAPVLHQSTQALTDPVDIRDLSANLAGAAARAKREEVNAEAPVLNFVARLLGVKTEERSWRVGAKGETKVAAELAKLGPAWHVLHAVSVGENGSDIDHVVIGPPGVITLNAKCHPHGKAWVGERMVMVNGQKTDYLRNSRFEARRASRLLSCACGTAVAVKAALVFVDLDCITVKQMPADVHVTTRRHLVRWLRSLPASTDDETVEAVYSKARLSVTWK